MNKLNLIEFVKFVQNDESSPNWIAEIDVDNYIESINSSQIDVETLGSNEKAKKICPFCDSPKIEIFQYSCTDCGCDFCVSKR